MVNLVGVGLFFGCEAVAQVFLLVPTYKSKNDTAPMKIHFKKNGYDYRLLEYTEHAAIYKQTYQGIDIAFEVFFRKKKLRTRIVNGKPVTENDFPADSDFGKSAWAIRDEARAFAKYHQILSGAEPVSAPEPVRKVNARVTLVEAE